jgi:hypothetical protein
MKYILFLTSTILLFSAFIGLHSTAPIKTEVVTLNDNEIYPDDYKYKGEYWAPYEWTEELTIYKGELSNETPIILRSMETDVFSFDNFREYMLSNIKDLSFPIYYERAGLNQSYSRKLIYKHNDGDFVDYSKIIFSSKDGRTELFNYALKSFEKIEKYFPNTWKIYYLSVLDNCILFTEKYTNNRDKYRELEKKHFNDYSGIMINELGGQYNAFMYRRIEHDKVPIQEINSYLSKLKLLLAKSVNSESKSNYKNVIINNGSIILSDNSINAYEGAQIKVWNKKSEKSLTFSWFSHMKCLKDNSTNYYMIFYDGKNSLIDENLNIIRTAKSN